MTGSVHGEALRVLQLTDPEIKAGAADALYAAWSDGGWDNGGGDDTGPVMRLPVPGRPTRPRLVPPGEVPSRRLSSLEGRLALIHAVAHIEFNAINLALDAVYRFRDMPGEFYSDWLQVAAEEAKHFRLLRERLRELGRDYGDYPAHNGLWKAAVETDHDVLVRMALVPRVLEARGLDVTPGMMERLRRVGDMDTVAILDIILREEIGHVAIGSRWYAYACERRGMEPVSTFRRLISEYMPDKVRGPFHREARLQAGFSESELTALERLNPMEN